MLGVEDGVIPAGSSSVNVVVDQGWKPSKRPDDRLVNVPLLGIKWQETTKVVIDLSAELVVGKTACDPFEVPDQVVLIDPSVVFGEEKEAT